MNCCFRRVSAIVATISLIWTHKQCSNLEIAELSILTVYSSLTISMHDLARKQPTIVRYPREQVSCFVIDWVQFIMKWGWIMFKLCLFTPVMIWIFFVWLAPVMCSDLNSHAKIEFYFGAL